MEYTSTGHEMQPLNPHPTQNCKKDFLPECTHTYQPPSHLTKETGIVEVIAHQPAHASTSLHSKNTTIVVQQPEEWQKSSVYVTLGYSMTCLVASVLCFWPTLICLVPAVACALKSCVAYDRGDILRSHYYGSISFGLIIAAVFFASFYILGLVVITVVEVVEYLGSL